MSTELTIVTHDVSGAIVDDAEADSLEGALLAAKTLVQEAVKPIARISIDLMPGWALEQGELRYSDRWL